MSELEDQFIDALPKAHPLHAVFATLREMGLEQSPLFVRLEHVCDEVRTLRAGLKQIANGHLTPTRIATMTLDSANEDVP